MFERLPSDSTGITFSNNIIETDTLNILNFHYIYNGGGVGIGDFNLDGLPDLVFSGNQVDSKIYLNNGDLQFTDITEAANFSTTGWATGVSIVDINADGLKDIYISVGGLRCEGNCKNQLFINQGINENNIPSFKEMAGDYGLDDGLYTQQAAFFDYDLDGDLDVYLLHNLVDPRDKNAPIEKRFLDVKSIDQLFRNDGPADTNQKDSPVVFTDVSQELGIIHKGFGLGISIDDFNRDGWPDIYIANDFLSDDLMYLNKGTNNKQHTGFNEVSKQHLKHSSYNSMGVDIADVNNDALPDVFVLDMMPHYQERQMNMLGFNNYNKFMLTLEKGYTPQFIRNTLQLHNGLLNEDLLPFSEVAYLSGIHNTDWSWAPLLADFDNDGDRDIYVTNGYGKDITDLDFINYSNQAFQFGTPESKRKKLFGIVQEMKSVSLPNFIFENKGNLNFENKEDQWLEKTNSISNGAVYSDLDNDGDLDIVVNNIDAEAFVLENKTTANPNTNFLKIKLVGNKANPSGFGSSVYVWANGEKQYHYQAPVRGYLSTMDELIHIGLGASSQIDSMEVLWPDGQVTLLENIVANQTLEITKETTQKNKKESTNLKSEQHFVSNIILRDYLHQENDFQDFDVQPLLLHQHSRQGPCLAAANVDGLPGDEIFIGGAKGIASQILYVSNDGVAKTYSLPDSLSEDTDAAFFDLDNDGDLDLYVVSGGAEFGKDASELQDRVYINDGNGNMERAINALPDFKSSGSCVVPTDFDQDGDVDLFVGGRLIPGEYPRPASSYLLVNENGKLIDKTQELLPNLKDIGMISDAVWSDFDKDGWKDLILVGEWMSILVFKNNKGAFSSEAIKVENTKGLWNCIAAADIDSDGDEDYLVGNLGLNSRLQASRSEPVTIYKNDYDKNGSPDPLIGQYYLNQNGKRKSYPIHARDDVMKQLVKMKRQYLKYADFGKTSFPDLLKTNKNSDDYLLADQFQSIVLENIGDGNFAVKPLPRQAQYAPVQSILTDDFDEDGFVDVLLVGNDYTCEKNGGWYDASNGLFLKGSKEEKFKVVETSESGFFVPGDARDLVEMKKHDGKKIILATQNSGTIKTFEYINKTEPKQVFSKSKSANKIELTTND